MTRKATLTLAALAATTAVPLAEAADPDGFYLGGNVGYHRFENASVADGSDGFEASNAGWKARLGVRDGGVLSGEIGFVDFGDLDDSGSSVSADGIEVAITASLPLNGPFQPHGRVGQLFWDTESDGAAFGANGDSGEDLFYGVGARIDLAHNVDLRLDYERYALDEADVDLASVGLDLQFD